MQHAPISRGSETRAAAGAFTGLAASMAAHALIETARDTLFFTRLPPARLAWVYLAMAAGSLLVARAQRAFARLESRRVLAALLGVSGLVTLLFFLLADSQHAAVFYALYLWAGIYVSVVLLQFWVTVSGVYTIARAKRVYAFIGAGGMVGAIAGSGLARVLVVRGGAGALLAAAGAILLLNAAGTWVGLRGAIEPTLVHRPLAIGTTVEELRRLRADPYVTRVAALVLVSTLALTAVDYLYKTAVAGAVPATEIGAFFASVNLVLSALALGAQLLLVGWTLRVIGVVRALRVLPLLLVLGGLVFVAGGGLAGALVMVGAGGALRFSLHGTTIELLFVPVAAPMRARAKAAIDAIGRRGGQALASLGILGLGAFSDSTLILGIAVVLLAALWVAISIDLRRHYLDIFRATLRRGAIETRVELPPLDLASMELLVAALGSDRDGEVLAALDLLEAEGRAGVIPALVLYHPSLPVVLRALAIFERARRQDVVPTLDRLLGHTDPDLYVAALRTRAAIAPEERMLRAAAGHESAAVRATALVGLAAEGWMSPAELEDALGPILGEGATASRVALARALSHRPGAAPEGVLLALAEDPEPSVRLEAARAMGEAKNLAFLPVLLGMLAARELRGAARDALAAMGRAALPMLERSLEDLSLAPEVRLHLPRTISRFPAEAAAPILLRHLLDEPNGAVRFKILRGLGRLEADHPGLRLDPVLLASAIERTVAGAYRLLDWRLALERGARQHPARATPGSELLQALLLDREAKAVERLFRLLGLRYPGEDLERVHRGLGSRDPETRASSRELLDNTLISPLRESVIGLVDDLPDEERIGFGRPYHTPQQLDTKAVIRTLLERGGESLQCLAAYHVGELGLTELEPRLLLLHTSGSRLVADVVTRALELLARREEWVRGAAS